MTPQAVSNAVRTCKQHQLITPESGTRCLVLSHHLAQKAGHGTRSCRRHGIFVHEAHELHKGLN